MRVSTLVPLALATAPMAVQAAGKYGFCLGNTNADDSCKSTSDYEADFDVLKSVTTTVRTYTASGCDTAKNIIPAAKNKGFKVILAVWPDTDASFNTDKAALDSSVPGNEGVIEAITVGSEALYRGSMTASALLDKINIVKTAFPKVKVGTVDSWNKYADGTANPLIEGGVEYFLINAFAYWQGQDISNATHTYLDDMMQAMGHIQSIAGDKADNIYIGNGETGWPTTGGTDYGAAKATTANAKTFHDEGFCALIKWGFDAYYFEAFDESWKPDSVGDDGVARDEKHWGLYNADRTPKFTPGC